MCVFSRFIYLFESTSKLKKKTTLKCNMSFVNFVNSVAEYFFEANKTNYNARVYVYLLFFFSWHKYD